MRMRTDKLITVIFSVILGVIGLFTIYILGSSFLYDSGMLGGEDEYKSLEALLEEEQSEVKDTAEVDNTEEASTTQLQPLENDITTSQEAEEEEAVSFEDVPKETQKRAVQEPERRPAPVTRNPEATSTPTTVRTSSTSGGGVGRRARYEELKKKFNYGTDASGAGWFVHEVWDDPTLMRNALICYVSQNGEVNLATQYVGDNRLSHSQAQIQVGRNTMTTADASADDIQFTSQRGKVKERAQYRSGNNKAIVDQITNNMQQNVTITLLGNNQIEFTLGSIDKQAIRECKEMADLLSYL